MRESMLMVLVAVQCIAGLVNPKIAVFSYVWFSLLRPDILVWAWGKPFSMILAIVALISCVRLLPEFTRILRSPISFGVMLLMIPIALSAIYAIDPDLTIEPIREFVVIVGMSLLIPVVVRSVDDLKWLFFVMTISIGVIGFKFGLWGLLRGGAHFSAGVGGFMSDNNTMATGLAMGVSICWYTSRIFQSQAIKAMALMLMVGSVSAIVMTHSRGGFLAVASVLLLVSLRSKRRLLTLGVLSLFAFPAVFLVRDTYLNRLSTLEDVQSEGSAASRIVLARAALAMWHDYPSLGVGFGSANEQRTLGQYLEGDQQALSGFVVHDTYIQMLVDSGIYAFLIYISLLFGTIFWLSLSARRTKRTHPGLEVYPYAIQTALVPFAVGTVSLSQTRFDFFYMMLTTAAAWYLIRRSLPEDTSELAIEQTAEPEMEVI